MSIRIIAINIIIIILPISRTSIIWWIYINTINFPGIKIFQQLKRVIIVCFNQSVPKITLRSIADRIDRLQIRIDWFAKFSNRNKISHRKLRSFCFPSLYTECFSIFYFKHLIEVTDVSSSESSLNSPPDGNIVERRTFRKMIFKNKTKLLLFGELVYFLLNSVPKIRIRNLPDKIIDRSHNDNSSN